MVPTPTVINKVEPTLFLSIFCLLSGCIGINQISGTSGLSSNELSTIPKGAKTIYAVTYDIEPEVMFDRTVTALLTRGHRIIKEDKERFYINTEGRNVGQSTLQRMVLVLTKIGSATQLKISTEWKAGTDATMTATAFSGIPVIADWEIAQWGMDRGGIAFAESVAIAKEISGVSIRYE